MLTAAARIPCGWVAKTSPRAIGPFVLCAPRLSTILKTILQRQVKLVSVSICRGCGSSFFPSDDAPGFCCHCRAAFANELYTLYRWMREQVAEANRRRSPAFVELLLPAYRSAFLKTEQLRRQMLYPEWLADRATQASEAMGTLESLCVRGKAAVLMAVEPEKEALKLPDTRLSAAGGKTSAPTEADIRAFYYHSKVLATLYRQGVFAHERDFEEDERLARALFARLDPAPSALLDENDCAFGPPPAAVMEAIETAVFGPKKPETPESSPKKGRK